ncbi:MAG TPA: acyl-CoA synthetase FdrA [Anaerolineae bacterium]|nr:acyl-CoA synthetase FdrA [Anaerolineae bacterium]
MSATKTEIRRGTYYDSVVLMQLQLSLSKLPGVHNAGVMMGTEANKELLGQSNLLTPEAKAALLDDLIIAIEGDDEAAAEAALAQVDNLLTRRRSAIADQDYLPQSLDAAAKMLPEANWVLVSVPGRYAGGVARDSLAQGKHVFLYSDNVSLEDEISLKQSAAEKGLLVMGPDCGTAIINGVGLGFANGVRRGSIGVVGASGTGLQQVTARIHQLGGGLTHAIGTGGRDLSESVGAITARQALDLLAGDDDTRIIVLISKPPAAAVADDLLRVARATNKPVVVNFIGYRPPAHFQQDEQLHFVSTLDGTAEQAVKLAQSPISNLQSSISPSPHLPFTPGQRYLRGLFSGGTLAYEALLLLQDYLPKVYSNAPLNKADKLANSLTSQAHTIVDLGEDEFTVGRLHPMMDNTLRLQRLAQEAADPEVAVLLLDVVLGYGAHSNPAGEIAPAIKEAKAEAEAQGRYLEIVAMVTGTDEDPQDMAGQIEQLEQAGARVETNNETATRYVGELLRTLNPLSGLPAVDPAALHQPLAGINVGVETFTESLKAQGAPVVHVNWKPPAGGNQKLMGILERMKRK